MLISWGDPDDRHYEHGLDRGVLYIPGKNPIPWNGLIAIDEGGEGTTSMYYRDGIIYLSDADAGDFEAKLTTMFFPREFAECLGYPEVTDGLFVDNQKPKRFNFSYRSLVGSGSRGDMFGYQIHLVYNCMASIGTRSRKTIGDGVNPVEFAFDLVCTPVKLSGYRPTANYVIDTRNMSQSVIDQLEAILYGTSGDSVDDILDDSSDTDVYGRMPTPQELFDIMNFGDAMTFVVHPDGSYTVTGSNANLYETGPYGFQMNNVNAVDNGDGTYLVSTGGNTTVIIE